MVNPVRTRKRIAESGKSSVNCGRFKLADRSEEDGKRGEGEVGERNGLRRWLGRREEDGCASFRDSVRSEMKGELPRLRAHVENDENRLAVMRVLAKKREDEGIVPIQENAAFAL